MPAPRPGAASRLHNEARPGVRPRRWSTGWSRRSTPTGSAPTSAAAPSLLDAGDLAALRREVAAEPAVHALIDELWPRLTAERLLRDLFASRDRLAAATPGWTDADRACCCGPPVVAVDAGRRPAAGGGRRAARRRRHAPSGRAEARRAAPARDDAQDDPGPAARLPVARTSRTEEEAEELTACDLLDAEGLAERQEERDTRTTAERAAADRTWTYGHVIVDEAQELSAMAWRLLLRRCPTRSMTVVGDVAQTGSPGRRHQLGARCSARTSATQWRLEELTVNYRTPAEIMAVAADVLAAGDATTAAPRSVRRTGVPPVAEQVTADRLLPRAAELTAELVAAGGTVAVIVPPSRVPAVVDCLAGVFPVVSAGPAADSSAGPVVLAPAGAKGLEFDSVLVVDPQGLLDEGVRGHSDLYVALTRATQRLTVLSPGELPTELHRLTEA